MKMVTQKGLPILRMLQLEEGMLRTNSHNWCFYNDGTSTTSIVMGISGYAAGRADHPQPTTKLAGCESHIAVQEG